MKKISRRTLLRSGSTAVLLPLLESNLLPAFGASTAKLPKRLVFLPMGYGVNAQNWFPSKDQPGTEYDLPPLLEPFSDLKADFSILQNLTNRHRINPHAGTTNFLTCADMKAVPGIFTNGVSCDQIAADHLGKDTRHDSLAIGSPSGGADGHGGQYGFASWAHNGKPVGIYREMTDLYAALFGTGGNKAAIEAQLAMKKSSLDVLMNDARRLNHRISSADRDRVDEYFTSIRNIENRLTKAQAWVDKPYPKAPFPQPKDNVRGQKEIELAFDMMHLAMQSDSTRVMTYMLPTAGILKDLGSRLNPHKMSHRASGPLDPESEHQQRDRIFSELVAGFLRKLKATKELDGSSLLDHSLVAYGSNLRQGHNMANGPLLLAGHGGGGLKQGQNIVYEANSTPTANLWLSMLRHVGVEQEQFANSERVLSEVGFS